LHKRYAEQAEWTAAARKRLLETAPLNAGSAALEVGSGTGVISSSLSREYSIFMYGLDIDPAATRLAVRLDPNSRYLVGDGYTLPFPGGSFDLVVCHFLLLWIKTPLDVLRDMLRVLRPNGCLMAFAEPDYGGRLDHPPELVHLGEWQTKALQRAGADPFIGRKLRALLAAAGAERIFSGVLGGEWSSADLERDSAAEREILRHDLAQSFDDQLENLLEMDERAASLGERTLFIPTFFALGYAPA